MNIDQHLNITQELSKINKQKELDINFKFKKVYEEKSPVGYDLRGNAVDFNTVQVTHYRVIHCKLDSKVIDYRQCWDMIKDKS